MSPLSQAPAPVFDEDEDEGPDICLCTNCGRRCEYIADRAMKYNYWCEDCEEDARIYEEKCDREAFRW